jgi:hypothetical protein
MERRIEAVFCSYVLYGKWDPTQAAMWLPQNNKSLNRTKFLDLLRDSKLLDHRVSPQEAQNVFCKLNNPVRTAS